MSIVLENERRIILLEKRVKELEKNLTKIISNNEQTKEICYKTGKECKYDCKGLCKDSC